MITTTKTEKGIEIRTPYNRDFVSDLKQSVSDARWNPDKKVWIAPDNAEETVMNLLKEHYGHIPGEKTVTVKITAKRKLKAEREPVYFHGHPVVSAAGRDSGARVSSGVSKISGEIKSGGSAKYWESIVEADSVFKIDAPESLAVDDDDWSVEVIGQKQNNQSLIDERERLMQRIAEIDELLK